MFWLLSACRKSMRVGLTWQPISHLSALSREAYSLVCCPRLQDGAPWGSPSAGSRVEKCRKVREHAGVTPDWKKLGDAVFRRRLDLGMTSRRELAREAHVGKRTIDTLESGAPVSQATLYKVELALKWEPGSAAAGDPVELVTDDTQDAEPDLRDNIEQQLWAITELPEEDRWIYIDLYRIRQQRGKNPGTHTA